MIDAITTLAQSLIALAKSPDEAMTFVVLVFMLGPMVGLGAMSYLLWLGTRRVRIAAASALRDCMAETTRLVGRLLQQAETNASAIQAIRDECENERLEFEKRDRHHSARVLELTLLLRDSLTLSATMMGDPERGGRNADAATKYLRERVEKLIALEQAAEPAKT